MTESIRVSVVEGWIADLQSILRQESTEPRTQEDLWINKGIRHGLDQIAHRIETWLRHQDNIETLVHSGKSFLMTKDVNLSRGRYRKLEWYESGLFFVLAWRHGMNEDRGELMLEIHDTVKLSKTYLVYEGCLTFDDLAALARESGMEAVRNKGNQQEWVEKVWT